MSEQAYPESTIGVLVINPVVEFTLRSCKKNFGSNMGKDVEEY